MGVLTKIANNPLALLVCLIVGAVAGRFLPELGFYGYVAGQLYLAVISMAAIPLLVVATFFGLRQTLALPQPGRRMLMIAGLAVLLVGLSSVVGAGLGVLAGPGLDLDHGARQYLGGLVQKAGGDAENTEIDLFATQPKPQEQEPLIASFFPDNFFRALAEGRTLGILLCAILFGLAFAALSKTTNNTLTGIFEATYRALELIIAGANLLLPVLAFGVAAHLVANTDARTVEAMSGFLGCFLLAAFGLSLLAMAVVRRQCGLPMMEVVAALKAPVLISLTSANATATIPHTIEAMSTKLGFSRGIVELVTPTSSVFLRTGAALYFTLVALFVANLYGRPVALQELALLCAAASLAAFASAGSNGVGNLGYAAMVLSTLQLPMEAALALFLAIDLICEGPRSLLTLLFACVLIAVVSGGLPSERVVNGESGLARSFRPIQFAFSRGQLVASIACAVLAALLIVVLGIGVGMRNPDSLGSPRPQAASRDNAVAMAPTKRME